MGFKCKCGQHFNFTISATTNELSALPSTAPVLVEPEKPKNVIPMPAPVRGKSISPPRTTPVTQFKITPELQKMGMVAMATKTHDCSGATKILAGATVKARLDSYNNPEHNNRRKVMSALWRYLRANEYGSKDQGKFSLAKLAEIIGYSVPTLNSWAEIMPKKSKAS